VTCYPLDRLREEVAYVAYHLHWSYEDVMLMEHAERQEWVDEVARINMRLNTIGAAETTDSLPSAGPTALVDEA
jgi:hypothetical protein